MTEMQTIEGGWKDVSSLKGTTLKKLFPAINGTAIEPPSQQ